MRKNKIVKKTNLGWNKNAGDIEEKVKHYLKIKKERAKKSMF